MHGSCHIHSTPTDMSSSGFLDLDVIQKKSIIDINVDIRIPGHTICVRHVVLIII